MVDKRKIRLMTRMAMYEQAEGREDLKVSAYYRKDYVSMKMVVTFLWTTVGFGFAMLLVLAGGMSTWMEHFDLTFLFVLAAAVIAIYLALLTITLTVTARIANKKHRDSRMRVKRYNHNLLRLIKIYERERQ